MPVELWTITAQQDYNFALVLVFGVFVYFIWDLYCNKKDEKK